MLFFHLSTSFMMTVIKVIFFSHMISCMWWGLSTTISTRAWLDDPLMVYDPLRYAPFQQQYIASLYWTVTTLTTTGYGDITPENNAEYVLNICIMVMGATVFGYVVANVSTLVQVHSSTCSFLSTIHTCVSYPLILSRHTSLLLSPPLLLPLRLVIQRTRSCSQQNHHRTFRIHE